MIQEVFRTRTLAVFQLFDSFSGKPVPSGAVRILCSGGNMILRKDGGIFVLTGEAWPEQIRIESPMFRETYPDRGELGTPDAPGRLWLEPGENYVYPQHTGWVQVQGVPYEPILALPLRRDAMKLTTDTEKGEDQLTVYDNRDTILAGRMAALWETGQDGEQPELIKIRDFNRLEGVCHLTWSLKKAHKKVKTCVGVLYPGRADENGSCLIGVPAMWQEPCGCILMTGQGDVLGTIYVSRGTRSALEGGNH